MSLDKTWGNPAVSTFKKRYIRAVHVGRTEVLVHKDIASIVQAYLSSLLPADYDVELQSWQPTRTPNLPVDFGLAVEIPEDVDLSTSQDYGLHVGGGWLTFQGTPEEAQELSDRLEAKRLAPPEPAVTREWKNQGPGKRTLQLGDKGDDVYFFQLFVGCPTVEGTFDKVTGQYAATLNTRYGLPPVEEVTENTWKAILPSERALARSYIERGVTGLIVRVLQAGLVAYDWDSELRVNGRFDRPTDHAVRRMQDVLGLRVSGKVRLPEWTAVLNREMLDS